MNKHSALLDRWCRSRICVGRGYRHGRSDVEDVNIVEDLAGILVDTDRKEPSPVPGRSCDPDLLSPDHRGRPATIVDRSLPGNIARSPGKWQGADRRMTISRWPSELPPWFRSGDQCRCSKRRKNEAGHANLVILISWSLWDESLIVRNSS